MVLTPPPFWTMFKKTAELVTGGTPKTLLKKIYIVFGSGGCNGCLNKDDPENDRLIDFVDDLEAFYKEHNYSSFMSRF